VSRQRMRDGAKKSAEIQKERKIKRILDHKKHCEQCNKFISYEKRRNKFCSHSCSAKKNNLGVCRNLDGPPKRSFVKKKCYYCGQITKNPKFCNAKCHRKFEWVQKKEKIKQTNEQGSGIGIRSFKRYIIETRGHQCVLCKNQEWQGKPIPLVMDHINGDPYDNSLKNLRLLCPNCDAQTPTYKGKNAGNGRHLRRQRYRDGKSF